MPSATSPGRSGPNPNSVTVGPNNATIGVPIAVARCSGALSFVTSTLARPISAADWRSVSFPQELTTRCRLLDLFSQTDIVLPANHNDRNMIHELPGKLRVVRPPLAAPDRARRQRHEGSVDKRCRGLLIGVRWPQLGRIDPRRLIREGQKSVALVVQSRLGSSLCIEEGPRTRKPDPCGDPGEYAERG